MLEPVLRNESIFRGQQMEGVTRIKISERCLPFSLGKGCAAQFTEWFETIVVAFISARWEKDKFTGS